MPKLQVDSSNDFTAGLVAAVNRPLQPKNSVRRISNLWYQTRGALSTIHGTLLISSPSGAAATFSAFVAYTPVNGATKLLALDFGTALSAGAKVRDITSATYGAGTVLDGNSTYTNAYWVPFAGNVIAILGNDVPPVIWNGATAVLIANNWTPAGALPIWAAGLSVSAGDNILPKTLNGFYFQALTSGTTGSAEPTWTATQGLTVVDGTVVWVNVAHTTADVPNAGFGFNHLDSLWLWGTGKTNVANGVDGPSWVRMSDAGNANSWNPSNAAQVGSDDGQTAQGGAVYSLAEAGIATTPSLVLFKDHSTYEVVGAFPLVAIQQAKTSRGCIAPRTTQFIADLGGVIRFTQDGFALYRGPSAGADVLISDSIRDYIYGASDVTGIDFTQALNARSGQVFGPTMYVCAMPLIGGSITRVFGYDITLKTWTIIDLIGTITGMDFVQKPNQAPTVLFNYISDGIVRRFLSNIADTSWDGTAIAWSFKTRRITPPKGQGQGEGIAFFRRVNINTQGGTPTITNIVVEYDDLGDGTLKTVTITPTVTTPPLSISLNISGAGGITTRGLAITVNGTGPTVLESLEVWYVAKQARSYAQI